MDAQTQTPDAHLADEAAIMDISPEVLAALEKAEREAPAAEVEEEVAPPAGTKVAVKEEAKAADESGKAAAEEAARQQLELKAEASRKAAREAAAKETEDRAKAERASAVAAFRRDAIGELERMAREAFGDDAKAIEAFLTEEVYTPLMVRLVELKDPDKLDPNIKTRSEMRKLERKLEEEKAAREAHVKQLQSEKEEAQQEAKKQQVMGTLTRWLEEKRSDYPHLTEYARNAAGDLFDMLLDNEEMSPEKAAELADAYYRKERERYVGSDQVRGGKTKTAAGSTATKVESAKKTTSLTNSGATEGNASQKDGPPDDPDASARYWADRLERDPEGMRKLVARRR
jgi:hypothetical protein